MSNVHDGHRERVREKYIKYGLQGMQEHELLELILFYSRVRGDTNELSHRLINVFGSLAGVFEAPIEELLKVEGVGEQTAVLISLVYDTYGAVQLSKTLDIRYVNTFDDMRRYIAPHYLNRKNEMPSVLYLDAKKKIIGYFELPEGTFKSAYMNIKTIVERAVRLNAVYFVLAHNHPSGIAIPSSNDKETTFRIEEVFRGIGVQLLDHIIFADNDCVSMAESGILQLSSEVRRYFGFADYYEEKQVRTV
ncbi:MAG: DNA repair protein RadC [Clostridiales bacterium]|nr:MAG: DNA repair protein RadC [Clostridiales bacterium]